MRSDRSLPLNEMGLIIAGAIWGTSFIVIAIALQAGHAPVSIAAARTTIGALGFLALAALLRRPLPRAPSQWFKGLVIGLFNVGLPLSLISIAQQSISAANASAIISTVPLFTLMTAPLIGVKQRRILRGQYLAIALGFVGVLAVLWPDLQDNQRILPALLIMAAALCYAISGHLTEHIGGLGPVAGNATIFISTAAWLLPLAMVLDANFLEVFASVPIWYLGLAPTTLVMYLRFIIIQRAGASFMSQVSYLIPCFAILWQWLFFKLWPQPISWLGIGLVLGSIAWSSRLSAAAAR